ncbi:MAG: diguanylate cyclase domain-containing protein [Schwartzia sp. (in: firmicutes)]
MKHFLDLQTYREILAAEHIGVFLWDIAADTLLADAPVAHFLPDDAAQHSVADLLLNWALVHPEDRKCFLPIVEFSRAPHPEYADGSHQMGLNYRVRQAVEGPWQWYHATVRFHFRGDRPYRAVIFFRNIDEAYRREEKLSFEASRDPMTGVYNKQTLKKLAEKALQEPGSRHALVILDMDGFKGVNDHLGHMTGDLVIQDLALSLTSIFRASDFVGRMGGDEFVVFLPHVQDVAFLEERCQELRQKVRRRFSLEKNRSIHAGSLADAPSELHVSVSIGMALSPAHGTDYETLLKNADTALYEAKNSGRDTQVMYDPLLGSGHQRVPVEEKETQRQQIFFQQPIEFIFRLLYETGNARETVKLLLELFAKFFNVQRVFIYQKVSRIKWECWFEWRASDVMATEKAHEGLVGEYIHQNYKAGVYGFFSECSDTHFVDGAAGEEMRERHICAFLHAGIMSGGERIGSVGFDDCLAPRTWSKKEHEILRVFANILGNVLITQMRFDMMVKQREHLKMILDTQPGIFWVQGVRKARLYYLSQAARHLLHQVVPWAETKDCFCLISVSHRACLHCALYKQPTTCPVLRSLARLVKEKNLVGKGMDWAPAAPAVFYYAGTAEGEHHMH